MKVISVVVNNPIFIKFQYELLKKFMPVDYEFIIFNDAKPFPDHSNFNNPTLRDEIKSLCVSLGIRCIDIQNDHHRHLNLNASSRHSDSLRIMREFMTQHPDEYLMLDSDMFPIAKIDINKYREYNCGAIAIQQRNDKIYMWPNLFYMNVLKVPNWELINWDIMPGCDTGGMSYIWLMKQINETPNSIYHIKYLSSCTWDESHLIDTLKSENLIYFLKNDVRNVNGKFWCEIYENSILHYRAGSNWNNEGVDVHNTVIKQLETYINSII